MFTDVRMDNAQGPDLHPGPVSIHADAIRPLARRNGQLIDDIPNARDPLDGLNNRVSLSGARRRASNGDDSITRRHLDISRGGAAVGDGVACRLRQSLIGRCITGARRAGRIVCRVRRRRTRRGRLRCARRRGGGRGGAGAGCASTSTGCGPTCARIGRGGGGLIIAPRAHGQDHGTDDAVPFCMLHVCESPISLDRRAPIRHDRSVAERCDGMERISLVSAIRGLVGVELGTDGFRRIPARPGVRGDADQLAFAGRIAARRGPGGSWRGGRARCVGAGRGRFA